MELFEFYTTNGFANSETFKCTEEEAIKDCERGSEFFNHRNWLYKRVDGVFQEVGHTVKDGYFWRYRKIIQ